MTFYLWIWKILGPIVPFLGCFFWYCYLDGQIHPSLSAVTILVIGGVLGILGIILGCTGWAEDVPPRMFWVKSRIDLLDTKFGYALTLGLGHFLLPAAIICVIEMVKYVS